jgi:hypothetical protein
MNFLERWFGVSLDGGSGAIEFAILLIPVVSLAAFAYRRFRARARVAVPSERTAQSGT